MVKPIRHVEYDDKPEPASTGNHLSVDEHIRETTDNIGGADAPALREGFAASSGVRPMAAETGGRVRGEEHTDATRPDPVPVELEEENAGLADS